REGPGVGRGPGRQRRERRSRSGEDRDEPHALRDARVAHPERALGPRLGRERREGRVSAGNVRGPGVFSAMEVAASRLSAERGRMTVTASTLANARTTRGADGQPYKRLDPVFGAKPVAPGSFVPVLRNVTGVEITGVRADPSQGQLVYDPGHPDANAQG